MSLRRRFAILAAALNAVLLGVLGSGVYLWVAHAVSHNAETRLSAVQSSVESAVTVGVDIAPGVRTALARAVGVEAIGRTSEGTAIGLGGPRDDALAGGFPSGMWSEASGATIDSDVTIATTDYRARIFPLAQPLPVRTASGETIAITQMAVLQDLTGGENALDDLRLALVLIVVIGSAASLAGGGWLAARGLRPVSALIRAAERVGADTDLSQRLPTPDTGDELQRLAAAFNASLARVESLYNDLQSVLSRQERFVADASHELRSPLTAIRTAIDSMRRHPDMAVVDRAEALADATAEAARMSALLDNLLTLARLDAGTGISVDAIEWTAIADAWRTDAERICAPRRVVMSDEGSLERTRGDAEALRRVGRILFDNIAKHAPTTTLVRIGFARSNGVVAITVADDGAGVHSEELPRIFDRFHQARQRGVGYHAGAGLGLSIAAEIVIAHGGTIAARPAQPHGLEIAIRLPADGVVEPSC